MVRKITPEKLPKATVYFPELHPHILSFIGLTCPEIDAKLKIGALCDGKILIGSSHIPNPLTFSYLKANPAPLQKGIVVPYLNVNFKSFDDYYNYRQNEVYNYLKDSFGKLGKRYTKEEHNRLYFGNQSTDEVVEFLEENVSEILMYRPDISASHFNDILVGEVEELRFKYGAYSNELNEIKKIIEELGYLGDPVIVGEVASSKLYRLPEYITSDLNRIVHRTYGYGGIHEFNTGLYTDSTYFIDYKQSLAKLMEKWDIREEILKKVLFKRFNRLQIDTLSWDDIFKLLQQQDIERLHRGLDKIKKESIKGIKQDTRDDCRYYLNQFDEIINPIVEDKIYKERRYEPIQKGMDLFERKHITWTCFISTICPILRELGCDPNDIARIPGVIGIPYLIKSMWKKWGPNELSLFLSNVEDIKYGR